VFGGLPFLLNEGCLDELAYRVLVAHCLHAGFQAAVSCHAGAGSVAVVSTRATAPSSPRLLLMANAVVEQWAAAGFDDTLLRWKIKLEVANRHEKEVRSQVQA